MGWIALPLDPKSFRVVDTDEEFCGDSTCKMSPSGFVNITDSIRHVPGHARSGVGNIAISPPESDYDDEDYIYYDDSDESMEEGEDSEAVTESGLEAENAGTPSQELMDSHAHSSSDDASDHQDIDGSADSREEITGSALVRIENDLVDDEDDSIDPHDYLMPGGFHSSQSYNFHIDADGTKKTQLQPPIAPETKRQNNAQSAPKVSQIPTLHLSTSHLRLFDANSPADPTIYCSNILGLQWGVSPAIDRLNMTQYVPELGIVVIATQMGRAAICSLTRKGLQGPFGLRIDWILPFEEQQKKDQRRAVPLLGIAVGAVKGHQLTRESPSSSSQEDGEDSGSGWLRDREDEDGVVTSFDPEMVTLRRNIASTSSGTRDRDRRRRAGKEAKRKRTRPPPPGKPKLVKQAWPSRYKAADSSPVMGEEWRGLEYSRRYRLMLTFYDHTVMTYELSRTAPFVGDPSNGQRNWRNRDVYF
jgi:CRT10